MICHRDEHVGLSHTETYGVRHVPCRLVGESGGARCCVCAPLEMRGVVLVAGVLADVISDSLGVLRPFIDVVVDGPIGGAARTPGPAWGPNQLDC